MRRTVAALLLVVLLVGDLAGQAHVTTAPVANDGTELPLDLPAELHMRNTGGMGPRGPGSGAGLCVFTSIEHSARWQNVWELHGFQKWMMSKPGGGWPEKVTAMSAAYCKEKGCPVPELIQVQSADLEPLRLAIRTGRMPGVTYAYSPTGRYGGRRIAHMVTLVAAGQGKGPDGKGWWCILDNNYPRSFEWMSEGQFFRTYTGGGRNGWAVIPRQPSPPPVPHH